MDWQALGHLATTFESTHIAPADAADAFYIVVSGDDLLIKDDDGDITPVSADDWRWCGLEAISEHCLGVVNQVPIYAVEVADDVDEPEGFGFESLWWFLSKVDSDLFYLLGRAKQIIDWQRTHRFCGQCGGETRLSEGDRSYRCDTCRQFFYPRLSPSIIVCVNKGTDILLAKNVNARGNFYSTLAGFVEPGESIETTVHREVYEEVGIRVKNLRYFSSQSWPFPNSLMLGFHAEYESGEIRIQEEELADAQWFPFDQLPNPPAMISISGWLINDFVQRASRGEV